MAYAIDQLKLWNLALGHLSERTLATLTDNTATARWLTANYVNARDAFLRSHPWNFALKEAALTADATAPAFRWTYRYEIPSDCLRLRPLTYEGERYGQLVPFEIVGAYIHTDLVGPINVRYTMRVTDVTLFDPLAVEALSLALAAKMAAQLVGKYELRDRLSQDFRAAMSAAREIDAIEDTAPPQDAYDIIRVRG